MGLFSFTQEEILTFFIVLVRFSVLVAFFPVFGNITVPAPLKVLLGLIVSFVLYPVLISSGVVKVGEALIWGSSAFAMIQVVFIEVVFALALAFSARMVFDAIHIAADFAGHLMGLAAASQWDPNQESQTQVLAKMLSALTVLLFLVLDGHHILLQGALYSYKLVGIGQASFQGDFVSTLISMATGTIRIGIQLAAPMAICTFAINIVYGVLARAMPQLNVLVLSFSVSAFMGLFVVLVSLPEIFSVTGDSFRSIGERMLFLMESVSER